MESLTIDILLLAVIFAIVAFFYASVGLGGGSSYTALLAIFGASTVAIPMISLTLNVLVTTVGSIIFLSKRHGRLRLIGPFIITSIPMAYVGGILHLPKMIFYLVLLISLIFAAVRIYFPTNSKPFSLSDQEKFFLALGCGAVLGLVAGIAGIGGGVYLVPLIIILGLGTAKEAAACGSFFIWVNSVAGLAARLQHNSIDLTPAIPLVIAAVAGGMAGSIMGAGRFELHTMQRILGSVLIVAIIFLGRKISLMAF
ncbi:MAG: sulfite exporter TauE/SafE family protein [Proteobacteria bacterium]|nr:sulfite exporter TauE/SafE family protein [Pseudomonadota bacterium]MBU1717229.1 sulfite exporter TauE/SafE family protein [Pseudomonadota bacterium]